ncbi:MAG: AI-2E family transporter [bacterium]|nr:AI-2E family transporter [bacterium]
MPRKIEISHRTIIFTVAFLLALWFLFQIQQLILALFVAVILMSALNPVVDRLERWRLPRWFGIVLIYLLFIVGIGIGIAHLIPPLIDESSAFVKRSDFYIAQLVNLGLDPSMIAGQISQLGLVPSNIIKTILGVFSNILSVIFVLIVTFYLLLERKNLQQYMTILFGQSQEKKAGDLVNKIEQQLGGWVRGEVVLMTVIGVMTYIGLRVLGVDFALPLAIFAGLLEVLPNFGPIISSIPAILLGFTISPLMGVAVAALYFIVQQLENSLIVPKVMYRAVGVNPLIVILSLAIGLKLAGTMGAILAIPAILIIRVILEEFFTSKKPQNL